jgi:hypothetical protein
MLFEWRSTGSDEVLDRRDLRVKEAIEINRDRRSDDLACKTNKYFKKKSIGII